MSWVQYFESAMKKINRPVTTKEMVVVHAPEYLEKVSNLVNSYMKSDRGKM